MDRWTGQSRRRIAAALRLDEAELVDASWMVNGPEWIGVLLPHAELVRAVKPEFAALGNLKVGIIGPGQGEAGVDFEDRTFIPGDAMMEDPVTGSFNAGAAQWLIGSNRAPREYVAAQGTALSRAGRLHVKAEGDNIRIGGESATCIRGSVLL